MEVRSKEELSEDIAEALLDLEDDELVKVANTILSREVSLEDGMFKIGASDFQPIRRKYSKQEVKEVLVLDGRKLSDGDRIIVLFPDGAEYEAVLEVSGTDDYSSRDSFYFLTDHHGIGVRIYLVEGMRAKWV